MRREFVAGPNGIGRMELRSQRRLTPDRDIAQSMGVGEAICTVREVVAVVNRPQDIEDEESMSFFGRSEGDAEETQG